MCNLGFRHSDYCCYRVVLSYCQKMTSTPTGSKLGPMGSIWDPLPGFGTRGFQISMADAPCRRPYVGSQRRRFGSKWGGLGSQIRQFGAKWVVPDTCSTISRVLGCAWESRGRSRATLGTEMEDFGSLGFPQRAQRSSIRSQKASISDAKMRDFEDLLILLILMTVSIEIHTLAPRRTSKLEDF